MFYIYRFLDKEQNVIYIGRTKNLENRLMNQHFTSYGHLPDNCYIETCRVEYASVKSDSEMRIYEIYLISKYRPTYNVTFNQENPISFDLPELCWIEFKDHKQNVRISFTMELSNQVIQLEKEVSALQSSNNEKDRQIQYLDQLVKIAHEQINEFVKQNNMKNLG